VNKAVSSYMRALQRKASRSRWGKMSKEERSEAARKLARKRWGKGKK
jgi:hypothetical protein